LNISGATLIAGNEPGGALTLKNGLTVSHGKIVFEIGGDGLGGYTGTTLILTPGNVIAIDGSDIEFDFLDGTDPLAFFNSGAFNIDSFFKSSDGTLFSTAFDLGGIFDDDIFEIVAPGVTIDRFDFTPEGGAQSLVETSGVPEPDAWAFFLIGFAGAGSMLRRRRKCASCIKAAPAV
ncbi:MAG TPA: PEP-CTERM sorting domain-containing protein, partial [Rhizomicrobium sp.]|nr:PEP-CTERM sorting domain-containing protein [Rhizomicrobium sp.]